MYSKILIPLDGSEAAEAVIPYVREIADKFGSQITLLQVVSTTPPVMPAEPGMVTPVEAEMLMEALEEEVTAAEKYLSNLARQWQESGHNVTWHVSRGAAADQIVRYAKEAGISLIGMSTHGRSGLGRLVFGSVASEVLRNSGTPILLIRPKGR